MKIIIRSVVAAGLLMAIAPNVLAADWSWASSTESPNQNWNTNGNWSPSSVPTSSSSTTVIFSNIDPGKGLVKIVNITTNVGTVGTMNFTGADYTINLGGSGALTTGEINLDASSSSNTISGTGHITVGDLNFNASDAILDYANANALSVDQINLNASGTSAITGIGSTTANTVNFNTSGSTLDVESDDLTTDTINLEASGESTITGTSDTTVTGGINFNASDSTLNITNTASGVITGEINNNGSNNSIDISGDESGLSINGTGITGSDPLAITVGGSDNILGFQNGATAGNAFITVESGNTLEFNNSSSAGTATLVNDGGTISFLQTDTSNFGTPIITNNNGGEVNFSALTTGTTVTLSMLDGGGGEVILGSTTLDVGNSDGINGTYDGVITGDGGIAKIHSNTWTLNGENTYQGPTTVEGGTLVIGDAAHPEASITSDTTIESGGTLEGYGTINADNVTNDGGTISPGGSSAPGKLTITGNYTDTSGNSTYIADISSTGESDYLDIQGVATLSGTVHINTIGDFTSGDTYTLLEADGGISGGYSSITSNSLFVDASGLQQVGNTIVYTLTLDSNAIHQAAQTPNQISLSNYILTHTVSAMNGAIGSLSNLPEDQQAAAFRLLMDQGTGATFANQTVALASIGNWFDAQLNTHTPTLNPLPANDPSVWVATQDGYNQLSSSSDASGVDTHLHGVAVGGDLALSDKTTVGAAFGLTNFDESASDQETASANGDLYQFGAYIHHAIKNWRVGGELSYGFTDSVDTKRTVSSSQVTGSYHANVWSARGDVGYAIPFSANYHIQPFGGVITQRVSQDNFTENSHTGFELNVNSSAYQSVRSQLGVNADTTPLANIPLNFFGNLSWEHEFADTRGEFTTSFVSSGGSFNVSGTDIGRDAAVIGAGVKVPVHNNMFDITVSYQGRFAQNLQENLGLLQAAYNF